MKFGGMIGYYPGTIWLGHEKVKRFLKIDVKSWRKVHLVLDVFFRLRYVHLCELGYDDVSLGFSFGFTHAVI